MSSNINPYNIDGNYPIAGQDNSSQGFRDNFTNIRNNFAFAESEITDLQSKVLVTSALNNQTINNDMAGTQIKRPQLTAWTQSLLDLGTIATASTATLDFSLANFQKFTTAGGVGVININLANWPASTGSGALGYALMRVWIVVSSTGHKISLPSSVNITIADIAGYDDANGVITFDQPGNYIFEFSSIDGGVSYLISDISRNRATFRDPSFYFNSTTSPSLFLGFSSNSLPIAQNIEGLDDDVMNCHEGVNTISAGDLWTATPNNPKMTFSELPGFHMYAARGNIDQGNIQPVVDKDLTGYITSRANTGTGANQAWHNLSSISFSANGTNYTNGIGGNISFWTAPDGSTNSERMLPVASMVNDQSTKFYGNVEVVGNLKTDSTTIHGGTYLAILANGSGNFSANSKVSTLIIDSSGSNALSWANIRLPYRPQDRQTFTISAVAPILVANINQPEYPTTTGNIKYVSPTAFSSGNVSITLTYMDGTKTWYKTS